MAGNGGNLFETSHILSIVRIYATMQGMVKQDTDTKTVRTRVAPSPTGYPHLGLIYQAIFDFVLAHKYDGQFVLRIEDTDRARFVEGAENVIYHALEWSQLLPDEGPKEDGSYGPYRQSERLETYKKYAEQLIASGHAYQCFCTKERLDAMRKEQEQKHMAPMYDRTCTKLSEEEAQKKMEEGLPFTVRMKIPDNQTIVVRDALVGDVTFESSQIDDQVILKSDGFPTYHLAVVVDDYLMGITHVFRGTEWLPSYPKHVLLWKYLGWEEDMPVFIHIPVLLNSEGGGKLSKRHAHTSVTYYEQEGFLPEAVVNYLANIVWNHPEGKEIFPLMDFGTAFDIEKGFYDIKPNGVKFDLQKLLWMNGEYIRMMSDEILKEKLRAFYRDDTEVLAVLDSKEGEVLLSLAKTRMKTLKDFRNLVITEKVDLTPEEKEIATYWQEKLAALSEWNKDTVLTTIREVLKEKKVRGSMLYKIMTGREQGLPLPESLELQGKEIALERLKKNITINSKTHK